MTKWRSEKKKSGGFWREEKAGGAGGFGVFLERRAGGFGMFRVCIFCLDRKLAGLLAFGTFMYILRMHSTM